MQDFRGVKGDIVIGRHTWKEYVRGLHEGWLGPLDPPPITNEESPDTERPDTKSSALGDQDRQPTDRPHELATIPNYAAEKLIQRLPHTGDQSQDSALHIPGSSGHPGSKVGANITADDSSPTSGMPAELTGEQAVGEKPKEDVKDESKGKKHKQPPPFLSVSAYPSASIPPSMPAELPPSITINFPHLLGVLNTPIRMYRYIPEKESVWLDDVVIDPRIGVRMRRFSLDQSDVEREQSMTKAFARKEQD